MKKTATAGMNGYQFLSVINDNDTDLYNGAGGVSNKIPESANLYINEWWEGNKSYTIVDDYDFAGNTVTLPAGVTLIFAGGIWSNGEIVGNNTALIPQGLNKCFETSLTLTGTWQLENIYPQWYGAISNPNNTTFSNDSASFIQKCLDSLFNVVIPAGYYYLATELTIDKPKNVNCFGRAINAASTVIYTNENIDIITIRTNHFYWLNGCIDLSKIAAHTKSAFKYCLDVNSMYGKIDCSILGDLTKLISGNNQSKGVYFDNTQESGGGEAHFIEIYGEFKHLKHCVLIPKEIPENTSYVSSIDCYITAWGCWQMYYFGMGSFSKLSGTSQENNVLSEEDKNTPIIYVAASDCDISTVNYDTAPASSFPARHNIIVENKGEGTVFSGSYLLQLYRNKSQFVEGLKINENTVLNNPTRIGLFNNKSSFSYFSFISRFNNQFSYIYLRQSVTIKKYSGVGKNFDTDLTATITDETENITLTDIANIFKNVGSPGRITFLNEASKSVDYVEIIINYSGLLYFIYLLHNGGISGSGQGTGFFEYIKRFQLILTNVDTGQPVVFNQYLNATGNNGEVIDFGQILGINCSNVILRLIGCSAINVPIDISELSANAFQNPLNPTIDIGGGQKIFGTLEVDGLKESSLPVYADNTAALAGGLTEGMPYRTSTGIRMVTF